MDRNPFAQWAGQALPAASSSAPASPTLTQLGYNADQGAQVGMAVSVVPIVGLVLGAVLLSAINPSDVVPRWFWAVLGGGVGLAAGNALGVAAVQKITPANPVQASGSFDETAFYQQLGQSLSSQIQSAMSSSASPTTATPTTIPASLTPQSTS